MIPRKQFDAYNRAVANLSGGASREVESRVWAWLRTDEGRAASVAECREYAKGVMSGVVQAYDEAAASLAAEWYDQLAADAGHGKLPEAVTATVYSPEKPDEVARYQARKLVKGDLRGFAKACGEYASNDVLRSLNETVIRNVGRDAKRGVRFARVTTGFENCPFCIMLASRGAVYHTRESAGEFRHFHRRCDCKVVPGFEDDQYAELVEGHDPKDELRAWKRIESARKGRVTAYDGTAQLEGELTEYASELADAWSSYRARPSTKTYRASYAEYVASLVPDNPIRIEDFTKLEPKELQEAAWLARAGHKVTLRNANDRKDVPGANTSDILVDGILCDFKKIESGSLSKLSRRVTEKLGRQGPYFLVDISESSITRDAAEARISRLLDDERIEGVFLVSSGTIELMKKA